MSIPGEFENPRAAEPVAGTVLPCPVRPMALPLAGLEVVGALLEGCRKVKGQEGYFRALAGFDAAHRGGLESRDLAAQLSNAAKRALKDSELRRKIAVPRVSFESSCAKRVRAILAAFR